MTSSTALKSDGGNAAVEFGLTAPVFVALLLGALQGSLMFWTQLGLQHAVERAARCAVINASLCDTDAKVKAFAVGEALASSVTINTFTLLPNETCGKKVTATTQASFVGLSVNLSASSCFPQ